MSALVDFAEAELRRAGMFDADADYGGALGRHVLEMVRLFASEGHSGGSAHLTADILGRLLRWKPLSPLTSDPAEWNDVSACSGRPMWQSRRNPSTFSVDGGATWYDIDKGERAPEVAP